MFIITFMIIAIFSNIVGVKLWLLKSIIIAIILMIVEAISIKGTDNITIPISACALLFLM